LIVRVLAAFILCTALLSGYCSWRGGATPEKLAALPEQDLARAVIVASGRQQELEPTAFPEILHLIGSLEPYTGPDAGIRAPWIQFYRLELDWRSHGEFRIILETNKGLDGNVVARIERVAWISSARHYWCDELLRWIESKVPKPADADVKELPSLGS